MAFFGNFDTSGTTYYLYVTTPERQPVSFTINAPGTGYNATGAVRYGEVATFAFESSEYELGSTSDRGKAIIVRTESDGELTVYGGNLRAIASDSFLFLPNQPDQGRSTYKYIAASYFTTVSGADSSVAIIAQYSDTLLSITPKVDTTIDTIFTPAGTTTNVALQEAETFLIASSNDLTGLIVVSNKPLALLSGHMCTNIPTFVRFCDPLVEQIPPVSTWGKQFVTAPLKGRQAYDFFRVVASENSTEVVVTCISSITTDPVDVTNIYQLGEGSFAEFNASSDQYCFIQGSANILVLQYSVGIVADFVTGDPTMIIVPAITQYCNQYSLPTIQPSDGSITFTHYMNILIPMAFYQLDQIFLNNQPLSSYNLTFTVIEQAGVPQVYAAQVDLTEGVHTLFHTDPGARLGVVMYGFTFVNSYGHPGGLQLVQGAVLVHVLHACIDPCAVCPVGWDPQFLLVQNFQCPFSHLFLHTGDSPRSSSITLTPTFGSIYGGTPVTVTLPEQGSDRYLLTSNLMVDILCIFDQVETRGVAVSANVVLCVSPAMSKLGFVPFQLRIALGTEDIFANSSGFVASKCTV